MDSWWYCYRDEKPPPGSWVVHERLFPTFSYPFQATSREAAQAMANDGKCGLFACPHIGLPVASAKHVNSREREKASREREVFKLFVRLTKYPVRPASIEQDAPDIRCGLENGEPATFELVTIDSESSSRAYNNFFATGHAWHRAMSAMPKDRVAAYLERYKHARITPVFRERPGQRDLAKRLELLIDGLLEQPAGFVGSLNCGDDLVRVEALEPWQTRGPISLDSLSVDPQPVVWDRIREKVEKRYKISGRFELIAYSYRDTLFHQAPEDATPPADIGEWLRDSAFQRLWIVEWHFKKIYRRIERPN